MEKYYKERFEFQRRMSKKIASYVEVNEILEKLRADLEPIDVNMGINSGTALVGLSRFKGTMGARMTYTASGQVTNVAARLAEHAKGGDILIGEGTRNLIRGFWPVYDQGEVRLKGLEQPVRIYSLLEGEHLIENT